MTNTFEHPMLHLIDIKTLRVIEAAPWCENRWLGENEIFARGLVQYQVRKQQINVNHYYVFAQRLEQ